MIPMSVEMFSIFGFYRIAFIALMFISVRGQFEEDCVDTCPEGDSGGETWNSRLRSLIHGTTVELMWDPYQGPEGAHYQIYVRSIQTNSTNITIMVENTTAYVLRGLKANTDYETQMCVVPSICGECVLCFTTGCDLVTPTQPSLNGSAINALSVKLTWDHHVGQVDSYIITYFPVNEPLQQLNITVNGTKFTIIVGNLSPNTAYQFVIRAMNDNGTSLPSNPVTLTTFIQSDSPGYLLVSDAHGMSYYFTVSLNLEEVTHADTFVSFTEENFIMSDGVTGIGFYPVDNISGYIFTSSSSGDVTRYNAIFNTSLTTGNISVAGSSVVMNRTPAKVSLISVDWLNDMLYWLETVNGTYVAIMHSLLNGSEIDCVTIVNVINANVTGIEVDPIHGFLYWSVQGLGGGIFRLDLTLAKHGSCFSFVSSAVNIIMPNFAATGIYSMTLNLEDSLLYFATENSTLSSISLGDEQIVNYTHNLTILNARSIVSYNEYLAVVSLQNDFSTVFVNISSQQKLNVVIILFTTPPPSTTHLFMIHDEVQPLAIPPGPVINAKFLPTNTSIHFSWNPPYYTDSLYGPSAFNRWMYTLNLLNTSNTILGNDYQYNDLLPNMVYIIDIFPSMPGSVGSDDDILMSSWIVMTVNDVVPMPNIIIATDSGIYTFSMNNRQAVQLSSYQQCVGVTYDIHHNTIYWTTVNRLLVQLSLNSENKMSHIIQNQLSGPTSVGVDYIGQRLYWIESSNTIRYISLQSTDTVSKVLFNEDDITGFTDIAIDSPSGLLFWTHNGRINGISILRLNGIGDRTLCVNGMGDNSQYLAITIDTENKRIFWIKEKAESIQIGVADYGNGLCINHFNKTIGNELSIGRISMTYVADFLLFASSNFPNMIFIAASNFSSYLSPDYQLAVGCYNISIDTGDAIIQSIIANQTSQQFLSVRLADGDTIYEGRVEVYYNGEWGTVCDNGWDLNDAEVVCRELGFGPATTATREAYHGPGSGQIWLEELNCVGTELTIRNCSHSGWGIHNCSHNEDAGVNCSPYYGETSTTASGTNITVIIGGVVGGIVLMLVILCITMYCVVHTSKKKRATSKYFFKPASSFRKPIHKYNSSRDSKIDARISLFKKWKEQLGAYMIDYSTLTVEEMIGKGKFGVVHKAWYAKANSKTEVAIKIVKDVSPSNVQKFIEECILTSKLDHHNVLSIIGVSINPQNATLLMIMAFMDHGDVKSFLKSKRGDEFEFDCFPKGLSDGLLMNMCLDVAKGMQYLSSNRIVHRDLAARNCMLDETLTIKIADFGLSRDVYISDYYVMKHSNPLPVKWLAPEVIFDGVFSVKSDVWAFGVTCWEIFSLGLQPYPSVDPFEMGKFLKLGKVLEKPSLSSNKVYEFMKSCWNYRPEDRPCFATLVQDISQQIQLTKCEEPPLIQSPLSDTYLKVQ